MSQNFYISDLHFEHFNVIRYDNRPFSTVEEMNSTLITNWNKVVSDDDAVYILGDVSWSSDPYTNKKFLNALKGNKILIKGNHDKPMYAISDCFKKITDYLEIKDNGRQVILSHYFMPCWNGQFRDSIHLYGHVHNSHQWNMIRSWLKEARQLQDIPMRAYNVGCMMTYMNYTPRTLDEILLKGE